MIRRYATSRFDIALTIRCLAIFFAFVPVLLFAIDLFATAERDQEVQSGIYNNVVVTAENLRSLQLRRDADFPVFVLTADPTRLAEVGRIDRSFDAALRALHRVASAQAIDRLSKLHAALIGVERPGIDMRLGGATRETVDAYFRARASPLVRRTDAAIERLVDDASAAYEGASGAHREEVRQALRDLVVAMNLSVIFCGTITVLIVRLIRQKRSDDLALAAVADREREVSLAREEAIETVAHDLRNPLTAIMMMAARLRSMQEFEAGPKARLMLDGIVTSTESMTLLIRNILDEAKFASGSVELTLAPCDLGELAAKMIQQFELAAEARKVTLVNEVSASLDRIAADAPRLEQVLSNLIGNAIKFTSKGGSVTVSSSTSGQGVWLAVANTGIGIPENERERIFDRYWQSRGTAAQGSGLGLAISKAIIQAHGGQIEAGASNPSGTIVSFFIPGEGIRTDARSIGEEGEDVFHSTRHVYANYDHHASVQHVMVGSGSASADYELRSAETRTLRLPLVVRMAVTLLMLATSSVVAAQVDEVHQADRLKTRALNSRSPNGYRSLSQSPAPADERTDYEAARAVYQRRLAAWRQRVVQCEAGYYEACRR